MIVVDANVLVYHLAGNHPDFSPRSTRLLERIVAGDESGYISVVAIAETLYSLRSSYGVPVQESALHLLAICQSGSIQSEIKPALLWALQTTASQRALSFPDSYQMAAAHELGINRVATFDKKMSCYPGVERIEPE